MRKFLALVLLLLITWGIILNTAEAARFGSGRSFGVQRSFNHFSRYQSPPSRISPQGSSSNRWLAPLAGLAAGGLLASLFMGHGIGTGLLTWLMVIGIGLMLWNFFIRKLQTITQSAQYKSFKENNIFNAQSYFASKNVYSTENKATSYPVGFDTDTFLRDAKVQFIRLQAAYDAKDLNDLREFTAPEVFAEIKMQLQERGQESNQTEVISLQAELLDATTEDQSTLASVKFSGRIREGSQAPETSFTEAWHFRKDRYSDKWLVVGVQQNIH